MAVFFASQMQAVFSSYPLKRKPRANTISVPMIVSASVVIIRLILSVLSISVLSRIAMIMQ